MSDLTIRLPGVPTPVALGESTTLAKTLSDRAAEKAALATLMADYMAGETNNFATKSAGEAGTTTGQVFSYPDPDGGLIVARRDMGGSTVLRRGLIMADARLWGVSTAVTTNHTWLNAAMADMSANRNGGALMLPHGNYETGGAVEVVSDITLQGQSGGFPYQGSTTRIVRPGGGTVINLSASVAGASIQNLGVMGLWDGGATVSRGIVSAGFLNTIRGVHVQGVNNEGFWLQGGADTIENCFTTNVCMNRSPSAYTGACRVSGNDHRVRHSEFNASLDIYSGTGGTANRRIAALYLDNAATSYFDDLVLEFGDVALRLGCDAHSNGFGNTRLDASAYSAAHIMGYRNNLGDIRTVLGHSWQTGFNVPLIDFDSTTVDEVAAAAGHPNQMRGNILGALLNSQFVTGRHSYTISGSPSDTYASLADGPNRIGPVIDSAALSGVYNLGNPAWAGTVEVPRNRLPTTSATPDVSRHSLVDFYAGSVAVTNFTGGAPGRVLWVTASTAGTVTLPNNANIKTNSGQTKTLTRGLFYCLVMNDGVWCEQADAGAVSSPPPVDNGMNGLRNSKLSGAVAGAIGSGGSFPTGMGITAGFTGLTASVVGTGTEDGLDYVDVRFNGTASVGYGVLAFEDFNLYTMPTRQGETITGSLHAKITAMSGVSPYDVALAVYEQAGTTGNSINLASTTSLPLAVSTAGLRDSRVSATRTMADASCQRAVLALFVGPTTGSPMDITIRLAAPQLEKAARAGIFHMTQGRALLPYYTTEYVSPASGASIVAGNQRSQLYVDTGALAALTVTTPASAYDGQPWSITTKSAITTLMLSANTGQSFATAPPTTLAADGSLTFEFRAATATWYRV